jgi:hypothetical protein
MGSRGIGRPLTDFSYTKVLATHFVNQENAMNPTIKEQFDAFHTTNPTVLDELVDLADQLFLHGYTRGSMKMLFEVLRWERMLETDDPSSEFKLNNNYTSHYARLVVQTYPRFEGFFETRNLRSA